MEAPYAAKVRTVLFYSTLIGVTLLFLYMLQSFFFPIFWAAIIATLFDSLYQRINGWTKSPNLSASLVLLVIAVSIILPAAFLGTLLFNESLTIYDSLNSNTGPLANSLQKQLSSLKNSQILDRFHIDEAMLAEKIADIAKGITDYIFVSLTNLTQNTLVLIVKFGVMLYTLFYFIRDGERFVEEAMRLLPMGGNRGRQLFERFKATTRATLKVTVIIGGLQGVSGGVLFLITDIEGALIWGILMIFASVIPGVGCSIIWAPASLIMLMTGHIWEGITILAVGVIVISLVDNLLRPILLGRDVQMHSLLIFLSTLGGIVLFGVSGFILGPIIASLLVAVWQMYAEYHEEAEAGL